jgi:hypothetical protein
MKTASLCIVLLCAGVPVFAEEGIHAERLALTDEVRYSGAAPWNYPSSLLVDEATLSIIVPGRRGTVRVYYPGSAPGAAVPWTVEPYAEEVSGGMGGQYIKIGDWLIRGLRGYISMFNRKKYRAFDGGFFADSVEGVNGISFILKSADRENYVVFFTEYSGAPGALDTTGRRSSGAEVTRLLELLDPAAFQASLVRADALGLGEQFRTGEALVWGQTNYSNTRPPASPDRSRLKMLGMGPIYDCDGRLLYMQEAARRPGAANDSEYVHIFMYDGDKNLIAEIDAGEHSELVRTGAGGDSVTCSLHTGFGGNIYFFFAGPEYTEVFRIRRTWGAPNLYALAVNGYTNDEYGRYVTRVLAEMSAPDLALLKSHLFALEGATFTRPGDRDYFEKQIWYVSRAIRQEDITLLDIRQALLDLILREEERRP